MKKILLALVLAGAFTGSATAGADDITAPIITNIFTTAISESSSSLRAARIGKDATTGRAALILNQEGYAPVILSQTNGVLTYNGVVLSTDTISGTDISVAGDLTVGDDAAITGLLTVGETLGVTGATSLAALSATTINGSGAAEILGAVELGAQNTQSTMTAAGALAVYASVTAPALSGTTSITGGAISGTTLAMSGAGVVLGAFEMGAENTQSTMTAAGVMTVYASVTSPTIVASAIMRIPSLTLAVIGAKTAVMGDVFICNDCSPVEIAISTAAGAPNTGGYGNAVGLQLD